MNGRPVCGCDRVCGRYRQASVRRLIYVWPTPDGSRLWTEESATEEGQAAGTFGSLCWGPAGAVRLGAQHTLHSTAHRTVPGGHRNTEQLAANITEKGVTHRASHGV